MAVSKLIVRELLYTWRLNLRGKILNCLLMQPSTILMNITKLKYHALSCGALELKGSSRDSGKQKKRVKVQMCLVIYVPLAQLVFYVTWSKSFRKYSVNSWRTYLPRWDKSLEYFARHFIEIKSWLHS